MHALHHGGILARASDDLILSGTTAKPAVALKPQTGPMDARFIFDASLDKKVVAENLCNCSVFLQQFTFFAGFFWKAVEEIQCSTVWIHRNIGENVAPKIIGGEAILHIHFPLCNKNRNN
jgi:hypothetical protein